MEIVPRFIFVNAVPLKTLSLRIEMPPNRTLFRFEQPLNASAPIALTLDAVIPDSRQFWNAALSMDVIGFVESVDVLIDTDVKLQLENVWDGIVVIFPRLIEFHIRLVQLENAAVPSEVRLAKVIAASDEQL